MLFTFPFDCPTRTHTQSRHSVAIAINRNRSKGRSCECRSFSFIAAVFLFQKIILRTVYGCDSYCCAAFAVANIYIDLIKMWPFSEYIYCKYVYNCTKDDGCHLNWIRAKKWLSKEIYCDWEYQFVLSHSVRTRCTHSTNKQTHRDQTFLFYQLQNQKRSMAMYFAIDKLFSAFDETLFFLSPLRAYKYNLNDDNIRTITSVATHHSFLVLIEADDVYRVTRAGIPIADRRIYFHSFNRLLLWLPPPPPVQSIGPYFDSHTPIY